jgi:hypothetical protein
MDAYKRYQSDLRKAHRKWEKREFTYPEYRAELERLDRERLLPREPEYMSPYERARRTWRKEELARERAARAASK